MRAVVQTRYGVPADVLRVREVATPPLANDEALVRVHAASVHPDVWHVVTGFPWALRVMGAGLRRPGETIPGTDVAGVVEAVGPAVRRFGLGDEVFGETIRGMQWRNGGAYAELVAVAEANPATKPANVTFAQAATVPTAGLIALSNLPGLDRWPVGRRVLVNGAGGGVGAVAVQLARAAGARVTAADLGHKQELLRTLGADRVVDVTTDDVRSDDERYDLVFDVIGNHPYSQVRHLVVDGGRYVLIGHDDFGRRGRRWLGSIPAMFGLMARSTLDRGLARPDFSGPDRQRSMQRLCDLLSAGKLTPVVDRTFPLEGVAEALAYLASGRAHGRIVVLPR